MNDHLNELDRLDRTSVQHVGTNREFMDIVDERRDLIPLLDTLIKV